MLLHNERKHSRVVADEGASMVLAAPRCSVASVNLPSQFFSKVLMAAVLRAVGARRR